jgi:hypothetical protein
LAQRDRANCASLYTTNLAHLTSVGSLLHCHAKASLYLYDSAVLTKAYASAYHEGAAHVNGELALEYLLGK